MRVNAVRAPTPIGNPCSRSRPRIALMRAVRVGLPLRAHAMERLEGLLLDCLHRHRLHAATRARLRATLPHRCDRSCCGAHTAGRMWRQQTDLEIPAPDTAAPSSERSRRLPSSLRSRQSSVHQSFELPTGEPLPLEDPSRTIRERHFENVLCEIDRHRRSIHLGLLLVVVATHVSRP